MNNNFIMTKMFHSTDAEFTSVVNDICKQEGLDAQ